MKRIKTGLEIEGDFFSMLRTTSLVTGTDTISGINGGVYRNGLRPRDSKTEDAVVIFTTANAAQFPKGVVTLNIYVPDIASFKNGVLAQDGQRCQEIEQLAQCSFEEMWAVHNDYKLSLRDTIHTVHDESINQSFVVVGLSFIYYSL